MRSLLRRQLPNLSRRQGWGIVSTHGFDTEYLVAHPEHGQDLAALNNFAEIGVVAGQVVSRKQGEPGKGPAPNTDGP